MLVKSTKKQWHRAGPLSQRFIKGILAISLSQFIYFLIRIALPPLFLRAWGVHIYGEWLVLTSLVAYLTLSDFGAQQYIINRLTQLYTQADLTEFSDVFHTGLSLFFILPLIVFLIFALLVVFIPTWHFLHIHYLSHKIVMLVLITFALQFLFSLPEGLLVGTYRAVKLLPTGYLLSGSIMLLTLLLTASALWLHASVLVVAILQIVPFFIVALYAAFDLNRRFPALNVFSLRMPRIDLVKQFIVPSLHFLLVNLSRAFSIQGIVIVVGIVLGSVQVVIFSTMRTIINVMRQGLELFVHAAWPEFTSFDAKKDMDGFYKLFKFILRSMLLVSGVAVILLYYFGHWLYLFWLHGRVPFSQLYLNLFLVYGLEMVFWVICMNLLLAVNKHHVLAKMLLISAILSIVMAYFFGVHFGLKGLIAGVILADLLLPFWFIPYLVHRHYPMFNLLFFLKEWLVVLVGVFCAIWLPWFSVIVFCVYGYWWYRVLPHRQGVK